MLSILLLVSLLLLSAFFSASEVALFSSNKIKIKHLAKKGNKAAIKIQKFFEEPDKVLITILIGNNIVNIAAASLATYFISNIIRGEARIITISTLIMSFLIILFGEISPKIIALSNAERIALYIITPLNYLYLLFLPLIYSLSFIVKNLLSLAGIEEIKSSHEITEEEAKTMLFSNIEKWQITKERKKIIKSVFNLKDITVEEIMVQRTEIVGIDINLNPKAILEIIKNSGFSRFPVYQDSLDNIKGILYAKDLLGINLTNSLKIDKLLRKAYYYPYSAKIEDILKDMQKKKFQLALVVDEYGGIEGLVSLEDILEEIVGEIQDEYDIEESPSIIPQTENVWSVDGDANIKDLNQILPIQLPEDDDYNTISGFILKIADKIPKENEVFQYQNITLTIEKMEGKKIMKVSVKMR